MENNAKRIATAVLFVLPLVGVFGLFISEAAHVLSALSSQAPAADLPPLPPIAMILGLAMFAMVPIFVLTLKWNAISRWTTLVIIALLLLFHLMHILEHGMMGDVITSIWILVSSVLPYAIALPLLWRDKPLETEPQLAQDGS